MRGILSKTLHDLRAGLLGWGSSLVITAAFLIYIYPSFAGMPELQRLVEDVPPELRVLYGRFADITTLEGFLAVEAFNLFLPALFLVYAIIAGSALIGGEEERGTLDLLLAHPVARWRLVAEKFAGLATAIIVLAAVTAVGFVAGGLAAGVGANYALLVAGTLNLVPLTLLFAALAFLATCAGWGRGLAGGVAGALATAAYLVDALAPLVRGLDQPSRYLPFFLYGGGLPLKEGVNLGYAAILLAAALALAAAGAWAFERRDVGV